MKSVADISKLIEEHEGVNLECLKESQIKTHFKRLSFLKLCGRYLEGEPAEDFLKKEKKRLANRSEIISSEFTHYIGKNPDPRKWRAEYNKETDLPKLREQLKTINFLLG